AKMGDTFDKTRTHPLVIFAEIEGQYEFTPDGSSATVIDCRFYVDPSLDTSADKVGLYRMGWTDREHYLAVKDVADLSSTVDSFDERSVLFPMSELLIPLSVATQSPPPTVPTLSSSSLQTAGAVVDQYYQFCYFHPFGAYTRYQLCGRSQPFRIVGLSSTISAGDWPQNRIDWSPTNTGDRPQLTSTPRAPTTALRRLYPQLSPLVSPAAAHRQTIPKRVVSAGGLGQLAPTIDGRDDKENRHLVVDDIADTTGAKLLEYTLEARDRQLRERDQRYEQQAAAARLEIQRLTHRSVAAEQRIQSLECELQLRYKSDGNVEEMQHNLLQTIQELNDQKSDAEEELLARDAMVRQLSQKCSSHEELIRELRQKLAVYERQETIQELIDVQHYDNYQHHNNSYTIGNATILREPYGTDGHELSLLRDKLQDMHQNYTIAKSVNESLRRKLQALDSRRRRSELELEVMKQRTATSDTDLPAMTADKSLAEMVRHYLARDYEHSLCDSGCGSGSTGGATIGRQQSAPNIPTHTARAVVTGDSVTVLVNEMTEKLKDFAVSQATEALTKYGDHKSVADAVVAALEHRLGTSWYCFAGAAHAFDHNSLIHVFGTYISFAVNDVKFVVFKTNDMVDTFSTPISSPESGKVDIIYKNHFTCDTDFEEVVADAAAEAVGQHYGSYRELTARMTQLLSQKCGQTCGQNWLVVVGSDGGPGLEARDQAFDTHLLFRHKNYNYIELRVNALKVIVIQFKAKL
ncbi:unnamed protein product, partial [Medioppia subpectinata]